MRFTETKLKGAYITDLERQEDSRGFFGRMFCQHEFADRGLKPVIAQANVGSNLRRGTIRGVHFQYPPASETKYVRCIRGSIIDIIVDLRPESQTFLDHIAVELSADNQRGLYIPERFGHAYQTREDMTDTIYLVGEFYAPGMEGGLKYDDPILGLKWPLPISAISEKDASWRSFADIELDLRRRMAPASQEKAVVQVERAEGC